MTKRHNKSIAKSDHLTWHIWSSVACSLIALVFIPILFGAIAAVNGGIVFFRGDKEMGFGLIVAAVAATVFGMLFGMIVWQTQYGY